jgi:beta-lactam-binding protein with PASTA domain
VGNWIDRLVASRWVSWLAQAKAGADDFAERRGEAAVNLAAYLINRNRPLVPDVRHRSVAQACQALAAEGLRIESFSGPIDQVAPDAIVAGQLPGPGEPLHRGRAVTVRVIDAP